MKMESVLLALALTAAPWAAVARSPAASEPEPISPERARELLSAGAIALDVRTADEYADGHLPAAVLLPYDEITAASAARTLPSLDTPAVVYCRSGRRSAIAVASLRRLGYTRVYDLGGINRWPYETER
ncbi:MAG TPA: rhodanese-like domain-containing protein [Treponemataceae bacterium]|nr:rhodanese-like domain-containing protein [Treponemataceae bacterium]